jgi:hypothetical protein
MIIETIAFAGLAFVATTLIATAYQRRQDVLYGPYIQGRVPNPDLLLSIARHAVAKIVLSLRLRAGGIIYLASVIAS